MDNNKYFDDVDFIPLKNLPDCGLTAYKYEEWKPGDPVKPNNVLIGCLGNLDRVSLVGRDLNGELMFASSEEGLDVILADLENFVDFIKRMKRVESNGSDY